MDSLDDLLHKRFPQVRLAAMLISRKLKEYGVTLSEKQIQKLEHNLDLDHLENLEIDLNDEQVSILRPLLNSETGKLPMEFDDEDLDSLESVVKKKVSKLLWRSIKETSSDLRNSWKTQAAEILKEQQEVRSSFESSLREIWGQGFDLLEMLCGVCLDAGSNFNKQFRPEASVTNDFVFEALTRLHARGCQIGFEILALLKSGFADGAMARWRTLHEIAVTSMLISNQGQQIAERYLDHVLVTDYDDALHYQKHYNTLGFDPILPTDYAQMKADRDAVCQKYGPGFERDNGWAACVFNGRSPTFAQIEEYVNLQHLRPFYKLANNNIHAGSKGALMRLGEPLSGEDVLVAGPSLFGLADPGKNTAVSLQQITVTLLLTKSGISHLILSDAIENLVVEVFDAFSLAEYKLEQKSKS